MLGYENYKTHLRKIRDLLNQSRIRFVSSGEMDAPVLKIQRELGIENIADFNEIFKKVPKKELILGEPDLHYNKKGHDLVAQYLYHFLTDRHLVDLKNTFQK